jgi:hypothetical protein
MPPDGDPQGVSPGRTPSNRCHRAFPFVLVAGLLVLLLVGSIPGFATSSVPTVALRGHSPGLAPGAVQVGAVTGSPNLQLSIEHSIGYAPLETNVTAIASGGSGPYNLSLCTSPPNCERQMAWAGTPLTILQRFDTPGNFTINASVTDAHGTSAGATALVEVLVVLPIVATAVVGSSSGVVPFTDTFSYTATGGVPPYVVSFVFGDGESATATAGTVVSHIYVQPGQYQPSVRITDSRHTPFVQKLPEVQVLPSPPGHSGPTVAGFSPSTLPWLGGFVAVLALAGVLITYVWRERRIRRESMELVDQLWEGDSGGPEGEP